MGDTHAKVPTRTACPHSLSYLCTQRHLRLEQHSALWSFRNSPCSREPTRDICLLNVLEGLATVPWQSEVMAVESRSFTLLVCAKCCVCPVFARFTTPNHNLCINTAAAPLPLVNTVTRDAAKLQSSPSLVLLCLVGCVLAFCAFSGHFLGVRRADLWYVAPSRQRCSTSYQGQCLKSISDHIESALTHLQTITAVYCSHHSSYGCTLAFTHSQLPLQKDSHSAGS
jgi:hypothetical protein